MTTAKKTTAKKPSAGETAAKGGKWTGGKTKKGYGSVRDPKTGKVTYAHRLAAEKKLGRKLRSDETVDHKNGNYTDNRPANLRVVSRAENTRLRHQRDKKQAKKE